MTNTPSISFPAQAKEIVKLLCLTFCLCTLTFSGFGQEDEISLNGTSYNDNPAVHQVMQGETLYGISRKYDLSVEEIKELNQLRSDLIFAGQSLLVEQSDANARQIAPRKSTPADVASSEPFGNAASLDDLFAEVRKENEKPANVTTFKQLGSRTPKARGIPSAQVERKVHYKVKPGDNIYTIANENNVAVAQVREWNAVSEVYEGQTIIVQKIYQPVPFEELRGRTSNSYSAPSKTIAPSAPTHRRNSVSKEITPSRRTVSPTITNVTEQSTYRPASRTSYKQTSYSSRSSTSQRKNTDFDWSNQGYPKLLKDENRSTSNGTFSRSIGNSSTRRSANLRIQTRSIDSESGKYGQIDGSMMNTRFYGIHKSLPIGSTFKLEIPNNTGFIEVEVVGRLNPRSRALIGLSPACITILEGAGAKGTATLIYE